MSFIKGWRSKTPAAPNLDQTLVLHLSKSRIPGPRQLKYVGRFLSPIERIILFIALLVAGGGLIFIISVFYQHHIEQVPSSGGRYIEGIVGNPQYINPLYASLNDADADIERLVFSRLYTRDNQDKAIPDLAEKTDISADGKIYTVHLRKANWETGDALTADDVIFTFELIQNPDYKSPLRTNFNGVTATKIDDQTISFSLREAYRDFPRLLNFGILPASLWDSVSPQTMSLIEMNIKPVGSGPYRFKSLVKTKTGIVHSYTLERNPHYSGVAPYLDEIVFIFFPSSEEMIAGLNNGQLSGLSYVTADSIDSIIAKNALDYHQIALPNLTALFFNLKSKGIITDKAVRQALSLALDRQSIVSDSVGRWGVPAQSLLPEFVPGTSNVFNFDTTKANALLDAAGWQKQTITNDPRLGSGSWRFKDSKALIVPLIAPDSLKSTAEAIAKAWQSIGVKAELNIRPSDTFEKEIISPKQFEIVLYTETVTGGDPWLIWRSDSPANISGWNRKDVDAWLTEARLINSEAEAVKRYQAFLAVAADDVPAAPLFWDSYVYSQNKKLKGLTMTTLEDPAERFSQAGSWYLNIKRRFKQSN